MKRNKLDFSFNFIFATNILNYCKTNGSTCFLMKSIVTGCDNVLDVYCHCCSPTGDKASLSLRLIKTALAFKMKLIEIASALESSSASLK